MGAQVAPAGEAVQAPALWSCWIYPAGRSTGRMCLNLCLRLDCERSSCEQGASRDIIWRGTLHGNVDEHVRGSISGNQGAREARASAQECMTRPIRGEAIRECWRASTASVQASTKPSRGRWLLPFLALHEQLRGFYFVFSLDVARHASRFFRICKMKRCVSKLLKPHKSGIIEQDDFAPRVSI